MKPITEELGDTDKQAGAELDGSTDNEDALELDDILSGKISKEPAKEEALEVPAEDLTPPEASTEMQNIPTPDDLRRNGHDGFTLDNVSGQIDGMVKNWFKFAVDMDPEKKEKFLALGERLSEISEMLKTDFK